MKISEMASHSDKINGLHLNCSWYSLNRFSSPESLCSHSALALCARTNYYQLKNVKLLIGNNQVFYVYRVSHLQFSIKQLPKETVLLWSSGYGLWAIHSIIDIEQRWYRALIVYPMQSNLFQMATTIKNYICILHQLLTTISSCCVFHARLLETSQWRYTN